MWILISLLCLFLQQGCSATVSRPNQAISTASAHAPTLSPRLNDAGVEFYDVDAVDDSLPGSLTYGPASKEKRDHGPLSFTLVPLTGPSAVSKSCDKKLPAPTPSSKPCDKKAPIPTSSSKPCDKKVSVPTSFSTAVACKTTKSTPCPSPNNAGKAVTSTAAVIGPRSAANSPLASTKTTTSTKPAFSHFYWPFPEPHLWEDVKLAAENAETVESAADKAILPRDKTPSNTGLDDNVDKVLEKIKTKNPKKDKPIPNQLAALFLTMDYLDRNGLTMEGSKRAEKPAKVISKNDVVPIIDHYSELVYKLHLDGLLKRDMNEDDVDNMVQNDKRAVDSTASPPRTRTVWGPPGHPHGHGPVVIDRTKSSASEPTAITTREDEHISSRSVSEIEADPPKMLQLVAPAVDTIECKHGSGKSSLTIVPPDWVKAEKNDIASCSVTPTLSRLPLPMSMRYTIRYKNGTDVPLKNARVVGVDALEGFTSSSVSESASDASVALQVPPPGVDTIECKCQEDGLFNAILALPDWAKADRKDIVSCSVHKMGGPPLLAPLFISYTLVYKNGTERTVQSGESRIWPDPVVPPLLFDSASKAPASDLAAKPGPDQIVCKDRSIFRFPRLVTLPDWLGADKKEIVACTKGTLLRPVHYTIYTVTFKNGTEAEWRASG